MFDNVKMEGKLNNDIFSSFFFNLFHIIDNVKMKGKLELETNK